ncbi:retropepsin-like aspartic protease [Methylomonas sp. AM2-LC]|uniref:retropepsin-like aspartic protease family protein n=1 Tax=Methylomonas sp. AM2-LC TaxID=3153301 RepID=UPI0032659B21
MSGLQNRNYYWQRVKATCSKCSVGRCASGFTSLLQPYLCRVSMRILLRTFSVCYPLIGFMLLWWGPNLFSHKPLAGEFAFAALPELSANQPETSVKELPLLNAGLLVLKADKQGHFRGRALINNIPMPYLIDTGATKTSIPYDLAVSAGLTLGQAIDTITAGGRVTDHLTKIKSLKMGNAEIKNLDAIINQHLNEVLIGMNTLKLFNLTQTGDTLTLSANTQTNINSTQISILDTNNTTIDNLLSEKQLKKNHTMKKTVSCDEFKTCKTIYSDH